MGVDLTGLTSNQSSAMTWDFFKRLRDTTKMKIVIKGILAHEDAKLAADAGIDAIIVSNHGARSEDSGRSTIDALPEIIEAVGGRMPVLVDSGFRRGTDIVKALCMGAKGVCIGRPYIWGLGAFGQPGVERVLELLAHRAARHHAADRRAVNQASHAGDGAASLKKPEGFLSENFWHYRNWKNDNSHKACPSDVEGYARSDGPRPVIPSECEGSKKDFSLRSK